jgi:hypothetical protein
MACPTRFETCVLPSEGSGLIPEALEHVGAIRHEICRQRISWVEGCLSFFHLETAAKLLISLEGILSPFSKYSLKSLKS